jgi:predicted RNase H-like nuclease (RuvC/YqgF family)
LKEFNDFNKAGKSKQKGGLKAIERNVSSLEQKVD